MYNNNQPKTQPECVSVLFCSESTETYSTTLLTYLIWYTAQ